MAATRGSPTIRTGGASKAAYGAAGMDLRKPSENWEADDVRP